MRGGGWGLRSNNMTNYTVNKNKGPAFQGYAVTLFSITSLTVQLSGLKMKGT